MSCRILRAIATRSCPGIQAVRTGHVRGRRWQSQCANGPADQPTIYALSSGAGRAAVAVIRVSGSLSDTALVALAPALATRQLPPARQLALARLVDPGTGEPLDRALVARFPGPASFTGEDCLELHLHGGPAVVRGTLAALGAVPGLRPAEPGEFTRRAFEAGKLDLTEVEGLADLLAAGTEAQRRQALSLATGVVRKRYEAWRASLLRALANVEAVIDFGEDEHIADEVAAGVLPGVQALREEMARHLTNAARGQLTREGVRVVLVGPPNAGKSSLLNVLAGRDAAIVSPYPGTTRDVLEVELELAGQRVVLADCAGIRETQDAIEMEGVRRARATLAAAHLVVQMREAGGVAATSDALRRSFSDPLYSTDAAQLSAEEEDAASQPGRKEKDAAPRLGTRGVRAELEPASTPLHQSTIWVLNKADLVTGQDEQRLGEVLQKAASTSPAFAAQVELVGEGAPLDNDANCRQSPLTGHNCDQPVSPPVATALVSCSTGQGLDGLLAALGVAVEGLLTRCGDPEAEALVTRARHEAALRRCVAALARYEGVSGELELAAEELRAATRALGAITGAVDTEEILDRLFVEFCIGK